VRQSLSGGSEKAATRLSYTRFAGMGRKGGGERQKAGMLHRLKQKECAENRSRVKSGDCKENFQEYDEGDNTVVESVLN